MPAEPVKPSSNAPEAGSAKGSPRSDSPNSPQSEAAKRKPMPFEPQSKATSSKAKAKQGEPGKTEPGARVAQQASKSELRATQSRVSAKRKGNREGGIPDAVSRRMVKRIAWCSGVPTLLGMSTFVVSYLAVSHDIPLPTYAVLLVSLGWFGLGVLGVSYGVLSASWDEAAGSLLGWNELQTNWARLTSEWKANSEAARANRASRSSKK